MRRKTWKSLLIIAVVCSLYPLSNVYATPTVDIVITDSDIVVGESFGIEVWANGIVDDNPDGGIDDLALAAFGFDYLADIGLVFINTVYNPGIDSSLLPLTTDVGGLADPFSLPLSGNVLLATMTWQALYADTFDLILNTDAFSTGEEGLFIANLTNPLVFGEYNILVPISITARESAAVPEPGTLLLLGSGITMLAFWRKRRTE